MDLYIKETRFKSLGIYTRSAIEKNELITMIGTSTPVPSPTMYSIQIGYNTHIDPHGVIKFINHSCVPNCKIKQISADGDLMLIAITDICSDSELTYNYLTTDYEIQFPFMCCCGHPNECIQSISGFKQLKPMQKQRILIFGVLPYLQEKITLLKSPIYRINE